MRATAFPLGEARVGRRASGLDPRFAEYHATRDRALRDVLVEDHQWLGRHCVRRFVRKGEPTEDLEQVSMVALVKAVDRFDPGFGFTFPTYAVPTIMGELRRHFRDHTWSMRVPRPIKDNYLQVKKVVEELQQIQGRSPTIAELAQTADLSTQDTLEALEAGSSYRGIPLDDRSDGDEGRIDEAAYLGVEERGYAASEARVVVSALFASLPGDREREIVRLRFVEDMSQSQIAARLGISQVHVSRLLRTSLQSMRRTLGS